MSLFEDTNPRELDDTGADAVCTIFETLNRTGVKTDR